MDNLKDLRFNKDTSTSLTTLRFDNSLPSGLTDETLAQIQVILDKGKKDTFYKRLQKTAKGVSAVDLTKVPTYEPLIPKYEI